jgi:hypothetical protein
VPVTRASSKTKLPDVSGPGKHWQAHDEWTSIMIRRLIVRKPSLMLMPFRQLWARMLSTGMLTAQFPLILRVVATEVPLP